MILVLNKKARAEYDILQEYEAGIVLMGNEVKSLRLKHGSLQGSYVKAVGNEVFLLNAQINPYPFSTNNDYDPKRTRKLLLHRKQINTIIEATSQKGRALIPLSIFLFHNKIKVKFAIARGKKLHERRQEMKKRDIQREVERELKRNVRM